MNLTQFSSKKPCLLHYLERGGRIVGYVNLNKYFYVQFLLYVCY